MNITIKKIKQMTADHFGISIVELDGVRRSRHIVRPRQIAMHCAVQLTRHSLPTIAEHFGKRDHTTVMHANTRISELLAVDKEVELAVAAILALCVVQPIPIADGALAHEIAEHNRLSKSIGELVAEEQTLKRKVSGLSKHLAQLEKNLDPVLAVITAITTYDAAQFCAGELQASKAVFAACHALKKSFPSDLTSQKAT